jgi:hypothetical protein
MADSLNKSNKKTEWYENDDPVNEYLDNDIFRKAQNHEKDQTTEKLSWMDLIK